MIKEGLIEEVLTFKKYKIWTRLHMDQVFAIQLSNGEYGFLSVVGKAMKESDIRISLCLGIRGLKHYREINQASQKDVSEQEKNELLLNQNQYMFYWGKKAELSEENVNSVQEYKKAHDIKLSRYPVFLKMESGYGANDNLNEEDQALFTEGIHALNLLAKKIYDFIGDEHFNIPYLNEVSKEVPLFEAHGNELCYVRQIFISVDEKYEYVKVPRVISTKSLKQYPQKQIWAAGLYRADHPIHDEKRDLPYYPWMLVMAGNGDQYLETPVIYNPLTGADDFFKEYALTWAKRKEYPSMIYCKDQRTYALLRDLCSKTGIRCMVSDKKADDLRRAYLSYHTRKAEVKKNQSSDNMRMLAQVMYEKGYGDQIPLSEDEYKHIKELAQSNLLDAETRKYLQIVLQRYENKV